MVTKNELRKILVVECERIHAKYHATEKNQISTNQLADELTEFLTEQFVAVVEDY